MSPLGRRAFLIGSASAAVLAACGGDDDGTVAEPTPTTAAGLVLGVAFDRNGSIAAGIPQRLPFLVFEADGGLLPDPPAELTMRIADGEQVVVARHGDDVDRPYFPLEHTFAEPATVAITTEVAGQRIESTVVVNPPDALAFPQVGEAMPVAPTPTVADPLGVSTLCTQDPPCPLHEVSLDAAAASGGPLVVLVSTPAFCSFQICGPVLDILVDAVPAHPGVRFVHVEVYPDGLEAGPSPVVAETLGLHFEPVLFGVGPDGTIRSRLDNIYDRSEMTAAIAAAG